MVDPAALGTLRIGLDAIDAKGMDIEGRRRRAAPARQPSGLRVSLARGLRWAAAMLEPSTVGEIAKPARQRT